jgi:hypothetical protein
MSDISASLRADVMHRAGERCEYCRLSQRWEQRGAGSGLSYRSRRSKSGQRAHHHRQPGAGVRFMFSAEVGEADGHRSGLRPGVPPVQPANARLGGALPLGRPAHRAVDGDGPRHGSGSGNEPAADPCHPARGSCPWSPSTGVIARSAVQRVSELGHATDAASAACDTPPS